jgi:SAM-dependent methyltransferase
MNSIEVQQSAQKLCGLSTIVPQPAHRAGKAKSSIERSGAVRARIGCTRYLSPTIRPRTSARVGKPLFDMTQRGIRRDRAFRKGPALFLFERTFQDILERIALVRRRFESILLIGCPDPGWPKRLAAGAAQVVVKDPGELFAGAAGGEVMVEDADRLPEAAFDLCVAIGSLDTVDNLPLALANIATSLRPDALLIGAMSGGDTLPRLRAAMRAADAAGGTASPHIHPRIDGPSLCQLLRNVDFENAVVDLDRVRVSYPSLLAQVTDLRAMAATNILAERSRISLTRQQLAAAAREYSNAELGGRIIEVYEIIHFAAWTPAA